jgi:hypothetical protein
MSFNALLTVRLLAVNFENICMGVIDKEPFPLFVRVKALQP